MPAHRASSTMPPYRAVLAVDIEKYSRVPSAQQVHLSNSAREILEAAFTNCGMGEVWREASFPQSTGDGYLIGVSTRQMPLLIAPLLSELQNVVAQRQPELAEIDRDLALRVRAAIGVGSLPDSGGADRGDGIGAAMNETQRVLDAPVLKQALADAHPRITHVVAGLTARVYEDAVLGGYTGLHPDLFHRVTVDLPDKAYRADAYLFVPAPSQRIAPSPPEAPPEPRREAAGQPTSRRDRSRPERGARTGGNVFTVGDNHGTAVQAEHMGDVSFGGDAR